MFIGTLIDIFESFPGGSVSIYRNFLYNSSRTFLIGHHFKTNILHLKLQYFLTVIETGTGF